MRCAELLKISRQTGIDPETLARWRSWESSGFRNRPKGRRKGKMKRPPGCLSMGDALQKYGIRTRELVAWREAGMPTTTLGKLIVVRESVLKSWIKRMGIKIHYFKSGKKIIAAARIR